MNKLVLFIIVLQVLSLPVSAQKISSVNNSSELVEKGNSIEKVAARIGLAPSSDPNGPYTGTEGSPLSFDGSESSDTDGKIKSYSWDFGDGSTSISNKPKHTYIQDGVYTVSLKVTDNSGLSDTGTTVAIIEDKKPKADFIGTPLTGMEPLNVIFTDSSESYDRITSWKWDFNNDGKVDSTIKNPAYKFAAGTYTVALTVCEADGDCDTRTRTNYITVTKGKELAPSSYPNGPYTGTEGSPVSFDGSKSSDPDGSIKSYSWDFGDGSTGTSNKPKHTYIKNGTYTVSLEVTDNDGLSDTGTTVAIIEDKKPLSDFTGAPITGLEPLNVTFTDSSESYDRITSWKWDFNNDGKVDSTIKNPAYKFAAGTYTVALTVCEKDGDCDTRTRTDYITATSIATKEKKFAPSSDPNGPYTGTEGSPLSFDGSKSFDPDGSIESYSWNFGDGNISNAKNPEHTYIRNGTYTVSLKVTDNDDLTATNTTTAIIARADNKLFSNFSAIPTSGLEPLNVTFTDSSESYDRVTSWKWDFDNDGKADSTIRNPAHEYAAGTYTVALTVCEADGDCDTRTKTDYINVTIKDTIKPVITITSPTSGQAFTTSSISVSGTVYNITEVSKVEVKVGNESWVLASVNTSWTVPSVNLSAGSNKITARATDNSSNIYETSVNVTYSLPANTPIINSGSGGAAAGSGGGGGLSGENISNIELIEKYDLPISRNATTLYKFTHVKNPIMFVNITGNTTMGIIRASGEILKGTSTLVKTPPEGLVYKNVNIWVGTVGFATPRNIKEAFIRFRVDNAWMSANSVTSSDIILVKWNGDRWIELETSVLSKDDTNTFFEGKTHEFSPFAITAKKVEVKSIDKVNVLGPEIPQQSRPKAQVYDTKDTKSSQSAKTAVINQTASSGISTKTSTWSIILILFIVNIIAVVMYFKWVKK